MAPKKRPLSHLHLHTILMIHLPTELWQLVFDQLDNTDICRLHNSLRPFHNLLQSSPQHFWHNLVAEVAHYPSTLHKHDSKRHAVLNLCDDTQFRHVAAPALNLSAKASEEHAPDTDLETQLTDLKADCGYSHACANGDKVYMLFSEVGPAVRIHKLSHDGSSVTLEVPHTFEKDELDKHAEDEDPCDELDRQYELACLGDNSELTFLRQKYFVTGQVNHFYVNWTTGKLRNINISRSEKGELELDTYMQCSNGQLYVLDGHKLTNTASDTTVPVSFDPSLGAPEFMDASSRYLLMRQGAWSQSDYLYHLVDSVKRTTSEWKVPRQEGTDLQLINLA